MNKLVSKNPVLRFKQGRKIEKFLEGGFTYNGKKYVGGGTKIVNWIGNLFSNSLNLLRVGMNGKPIVDSVSSQLNTNNNSNTKNYIPVEGVQAMRLKYLGKSNMDVAKEETHNYLEGLRNKYSRPFLKNNPSVKITTPVDNYYLKGFENRKNEIAKLGGVRAVLKMLGFTSGNGLDGKWGQNTEDAYLKYLIANAAKTPSLEDTISVAQNLPILSTPTINPSEYTFTESQLSGLGENPYYEPHPELRFNNFDRTQTRQWLRDNGFNPYSLTGALRKALRMILNGQGTDEDKNLIGLTNGLSEILTNYKYLKQGGSMITLPSRNIVERFKLGRKLLFAQNGSYVPVKVGKNIYQYNPYNKTYKGTQSSGENIKYEDIKNAFNLQYESIGTGNEALYRKKGSRTTWMNSKGKYVDKSLKKLIPVDKGSSEVDRFAIASKKGETRYFKTKEAAKAYQRTLPQGSSVFRDNVEEARGQVLKANRTSEKATEYGRKLLEKNNNLSFKLAYQAARKEGNKFFAYKGKVYKSDLENGKDNRLEMEQHYGDYLGFQKNPNLLNNPSREARKEYRKGIGTDTNRNANYKGETNSQGNARADKNFNRKLGVSTLAPDFIDAVSPQTAIGNFMNMAGSAMTGEHFTPRIYLNGFNVPGYASDLALGKYKDLVFRGLDAWLSTGAPGARINMTPGGTNVTKGTTLLPNGTRTFSKWHLNALGPNAEKIGNNILRSSKGTQYYIDNGQYMKNFEIPALLSNPFILQTQNLEK